MTQEKIIELAKFLHEEYENSARLFGWESQEKCRVPFEDLPKANMKTMLSVAQKLDKYWLKKIEEIDKICEEMKLDGQIFYNKNQFEVINILKPELKKRLLK